jgi:hypothetical protein
MLGFDKVQESLLVMVKVLPHHGNSAKQSSWLANILPAHLPESVQYGPRSIHNTTGTTWAMSIYVASWLSFSHAYSWDGQAVLGNASCLSTGVNIYWWAHEIGLFSDISMWSMATEHQSIVFRPFLAAGTCQSANATTLVALGLYWQTLLQNRIL